VSAKGWSIGMVLALPLLAVVGVIVLWSGSMSLAFSVHTSMGRSPYLLILSLSASPLLA